LTFWLLQVEQEGQAHTMAAVVEQEVTELPLELRAAGEVLNLL
jgi:hypothetical protein